MDVQTPDSVKPPRAQAVVMALVLDNHVWALLEEVLVCTVA